MNSKFLFFNLTMLIHKKPFFLLAAILTVNVLVYLTGHQGDLSYFLNESDGSLRNSLMSIILTPVTIISINEFFIATTWSMFVGWLIYINRRNIPKILFIHTFLLSPFILFPSKESLVVIFSVIGVAIISKNILFSYVFGILIAVVRPFYSLALLAALSVSFIKTMVLKILWFLASCLVVGYSIIYYGDYASDVISAYFSYSIGYFDSAEDAGSTDWKYIESIKEKEAGIDLFMSFIGRSLFPFWMLSIPGITPKAYFFIYLFNFFVCIKIIYCGSNNDSNIELKRAMIFVFLGSLLMLLPILVTNAGSATRYISSLPYFLYLIKKILSEPLLKKKYSYFNGCKYNKKP